MRAPVVPIATLLLVPLGLAACSGDSRSSTSSSRAAQTPVSLPGTVSNRGTEDLTGTGNATLELALDDLSFDPTFVKVAPGQRITVELTNDGALRHTFTSSQLGVDEELAPGERTTVEITMPARTVARFTCRFHARSGMQGALFTTGD